MEQGLKVNLGCGGQIVDGWLNVDYALGARLAKMPLLGSTSRALGLTNLKWDRRITIHDLRKRFPWKDSSVAVVYSSHTLEHLSKEEGRRFLEECHRVLHTDGIVRILVPDLMVNVLDYTHGRTKADDFIIQLDVLYGQSTSAVKNRLAPFVRFPHKCMYDTARLVEILTEIGFYASSRKPFDSDIEDIGSVELEGRTVDAVIVEGRKL